jgi:hypothetical protein
MIDVRFAAVASLTFVLGGQALAAQAPFEYRQYALESSVAAVIEVSRPRDNDPERSMNDPPPFRRSYGAPRTWGWEGNGPIRSSGTMPGRWSRCCAVPTRRISSWC